MWQRQKQDWIDRSTIAFNNSKNRAQQSTVDAWNNSKSRAQRSTMEAWNTSKSRCQRTSMGAWHKSADSLSNSKDRAQQSARAMVDRSVSKWNQSADQMHQAIRVQQSGDRRQTRPGQTNDNTSPPSSPDSTRSGSRFYAQANTSTVSSSATAVEVPVPKTQSIQPTSVVDSSLPPKEQIDALHDAASATDTLVEQTKQLRDDRCHVLGEIELDWINSTIAEADQTSTDLSTFIAPFWAAQYKDTEAGASERRSWTRRDIQRAMKKESRMRQAHSKVETVFGHLASLPAELNISSVELKDVESLASHGISELTITRVVSVAELPGDSSPVMNHYAELPAPMMIPKIVITQHETDNLESPSVDGRSPPPSYDAIEVDGIHEVR
ncbi:unnamed protein product [Penicillium salamii]|nr:unnamed protein product [Penicillium salamii]CAG8330669.1 unnamed protein product [Penicillium salamii]